MRWYRSLTPTQQRILLASTLSVVVMVSLLAWSVWAMLQPAQQLFPLPLPAAAGESVLPTSTPACTPTPTLIPSPTETSPFDISLAGIVASEVADARQFTTRWGTPLTVVDDTGMARAIYAHFRRWVPVVLREKLVLEALYLWHWDPLRLDAVTQSEQAVAFYAPEMEELYLRRDWDGSLEILETQLAYGYARALPDQYGDLVALIEAAPSLDRRLALTAIAEGDAFVSTLLYRGITPGEAGTEAVYEEISRAVCPQWQTEDTLLDDLSCLSFRLGVDFAVAQYQSGGVQALDEMILRPPRSTEQLLDHARYVGFEEPAVFVPLDAGLGSDWILTATETLGQAFIEIVLSEWNEGMAGEDVAVDWGGDLLQVWQGPDSGALSAWQIVWDNSSAAVRFHAALVEVLPRVLVPGLIRDTTAPAALPRGRWWSGRQGTVFLYRRADTIWLIWGTDTTAVETVGAALPRRAYFTSGAITRYVSARPDR